MKPNKIVKTIPKIKTKAFDDELRKAIEEFTNSVVDSFKYFVLAQYKKNKKVLDEAITDASPSTQMKFTLNDLKDRWEEKADAFSKKVVQRWLRRILKFVDNKYDKSLGIKFDVESLEVKEVIKARYYENIRLIKSIPQEVLGRFAATMYSNVVQGDLDSITKKLETVAGISKRRAKNIARDQAAKASEQINSARAQQLGVEYYIWRTSEDSRVSKGDGGHKQLNGKIFSYDDPTAIIDTYGNTGHPKERPMCRCYAEGIILEPGQKVEKRGNEYQLIDTTTGDVIHI